jgi:YHS domain-containing protein
MKPLSAHVYNCFSRLMEIILTAFESSVMAVDPVCGMGVDPARAKYKTLYRGKVYYFCSPMCKEEFEKRPEYYLQHGPQGMPHHH